MHRSELNKYFDDLLQPVKFQDYCPNGLQIEGSDKLKKLLLQSLPPATRSPRQLN